MTTVNIVEGQTAPVDIQLVDKVGAPIGDISGFTVEIEIKGSDGVAVTTATKASILTPATAIVRYTPAANDFAASKSPYLARWKVTDGGGFIAFFPDEDPDKWVVRLPTR